MMGILSFPTSDVGKVYIIADILFNLMVFPQQPPSENHSHLFHIFYTNEYVHWTDFVLFRRLTRIIV